MTKSEWLIALLSNPKAKGIIGNGKLYYFDNNSQFHVMSNGSTIAINPNSINTALFSVTFTIITKTPVRCQKQPDQSWGLEDEHDNVIIKFSDRRQAILAWQDWT